VVDNTVFVSVSCGKWLALDEGEGLLEYTLTELLDLRKKIEKS